MGNFSPTIVSKCKLRDLFKANEFGVFFLQFLTNKKFKLESEKYSGSKQSKASLTEMAFVEEFDEKNVCYL